MAGEVVPSRFAIGQFDEHAAEVMRRVVTGLARGQRAARVVQVAAEQEGVTDKRPYGSTWAARYKLVVDQFELPGLPSYQAYKPRGASYSLAVINGRVLIPFRHATSLNVPISQAKLSTTIPRKVSRDNGVEAEPTLFDAPHVEATTDPSVAEAAAAARAENLTVVYVAYVANADSDEVLAAWWGTPDSLEDDGTMRWTPERLDMNIATLQTSDQSRGDLHAVGTSTATLGFAEGELPPLVVTAHAETIQLPAAEPEPITPEAEDGDE
jgi:hypothetical protein